MECFFLPKPELSVLFLLQLYLFKRNETMIEKHRRLKGGEMYSVVVGSRQDGKLGERKGSLKISVLWELWRPHRGLVTETLVCRMESKKAIRKMLGRRTLN